MASNRTPTTFYGPDLPSGGTIYTVPANKIAVVKSFVMLPSDTGSIMAAIDGSGDGDKILFRDFSAAGESLTEWAYIPLTEGQTIYAIGSEISFTVTGDLYDV